MKRNVYLTILAITTTICILFGSAVHIIGYGQNVFNHWFSSEKWERRKEGNSKISIEPTDLKAFTQINVDAAAMDLTIKPGGAYQISYRCNQKMKPEYTVENNTLRITQNEDTVELTGSNNRCEVLVTVPSDAALSDIFVDLDLGDINFNHIQTSALNLTARLGDVDLKNCDLGDTVVSANLGDVEFSSCTFRNLDVTIDIGDLTVESASDLSDYTIDASADLGSLKINGRNYRSQFSQSGGSGRTVSLKNHMGDAKLEY